MLRLTGDAEGMAVDLFEKLGPASCDALVSALAVVVGLDGPPTSRTLRLSRVRWRAPWWSPSTATKVRIYGRLTDAQTRARRLRDSGYSVEVCTTRRCPWRLVDPGPWSAAERGEAVR